MVTLGSDAILDIAGLTKAFGGSQALNEVDFRLGYGEVRALIGQNGSGKSTLIKVLSGVYRPDAGQVCLHGERVGIPLRRHTLEKHGVRFVHQDLGLVPSLSVLENLRVGRYQTRAGRITWASNRTAVQALLAEHDLDVDPASAVSTLSQTERTIVAMIRALDGLARAGSGIVVLDEPTSALPLREIELLFASIRRVKAAGHSVILVTHHLDEVFAVADTVTVLRGGRSVGTRYVEDVGGSELVEMMIGGSIPALGNHQVRTTAPAILRCQQVSGAVCRDVNVDLHEGEILGLTGLMGAGHEELPYLLYGARPLTAGSITVGEERLDVLSPVTARHAGLALLPSDRQRESGIMTATVAENISLPRLSAFRRLWGIDTRAERTAVEKLLERFDVRPAKAELPLVTLSGGNQQKVALPA